MKTTLFAIAALTLVGSATAQTKLNANPAPANNGGSSGWAQFLDLTATAGDLTVTEIEAANSGAAGSAFTVEVFTFVGSGLGGPVGMGPGSSPAGWTSLGVANAVQGAAGSTGLSDPIDIPDIFVPAGQTVGVALLFGGNGPRYKTGTLGMYNVFADANLSLTTGDARSAPFTTGGSFFSPREFVGSVTYTVNPTCLTTLFAANNGGSTGWAQQFDLTVTDPAGVTIKSLEMNNNAAAGGMVQLDMYIRPGSGVGFETNPAGWTFVSSGVQNSSQPTDTPTPVEMGDVYLAPGVYGVYLHYVAGAPAYTNGTGTNQQYMDASIQLDLGTSTTGLFTGSVFNPRVWNGSVCYLVGSSTTVYCKAKVNSLGCTPAIAATGTSSASASSGFFINGHRVRNQKAGMLIYGLSGQASTPFQGGTLCVATPINRTPARSSLGNPKPADDCSGVYAIDFNAFAAGAAGGKPDPALQVPGTVVNAQWVGRDGGDPFGSTLSDAVEFAIGS